MNWGKLDVHFPDILSKDNILSLPLLQSTGASQRRREFNRKLNSHIKHKINKSCDNWPFLEETVIDDIILGFESYLYISIWVGFKKIQMLGLP